MEAVHVWHAKFNVCHTNIGMLIFTCYMPIPIYIVSSFVCDVFTFLYAMTTSIHVASLFILCYPKISIFVLLSSLVFVIWTQHIIYVALRFVSSSTFSIIPYSEMLSSLAVACGPTTLQDLTLHGTKTPMVLSLQITSVFWSHRNTDRCVAQLQI